jgi:hypothetical protein
LAILIISSMILFGWVSSLYAAEILGYPLVEKQAKFYTIILGVIAASVFMVSALYLCLKAATPTLQREKEVLAGELVVALQSAK